MSLPFSITPAAQRLALGISAAVAFAAIGAAASLSAAIAASAFGIAAIVASIAMPSLAPVGLLVAPVAVAAVTPIGGVGLLLVLLLCYARLTRLYTSPLVLFGAPVAAYILIGGANISSYRGHVDPATLRFMLWHVVILLAGALATGGRPKEVDDAVGAGDVQPLHVLIGLAPGLLGLAWIVATSGVPLLHPESRVGIRGLPLLLAESLIAGLGLYCYRVFMQRSPQPREICVIAGLLLALAVPGYRGWPLIGIGLVVTLAVHFGRLRVRLRPILAISAIAVVIIAGGDSVRRMTNHQLLSSNAEAAQYGAQNLPIGFRQLHFAFRETIALTQELVSKRQEGVRLPHSLLLADFKTMLPGKEESGGTMVGQLVGVQGNAGLTAGAVGAAFMDMGRLSYLFFGCWGLALGFVYRRVRRASYWSAVYFLAIAYSLHFFHRGIPKPSYVVVPAMLLVLARLGRSSGRRATSG